MKKKITGMFLAALMVLCTASAAMSTAVFAEGLSDNTAYISTNTDEGTPATDSEDKIVAYGKLSEAAVLKKDAPVKDDKTQKNKTSSKSVEEEKDNENIQIEPGDEVFAIEDIVFSEDDEQFYGKTKWKDQEGWISLNLLTYVRNKKEDQHAPDFYVTVESEESSIDLLSGAGTSFRVIYQIPNNERLHVQDLSYNKEENILFGNVSYNGHDGWISLNSTTVIKLDPDRKTVLYTAAVYNTGSAGLTFNYKDKDGKDMTANLPEGTKVSILSIDDNGNGIINYQGHTGWIALRYTKADPSYKAAQPTYGFINEALYFVEGTGGGGLNMRTAPNVDVSTYGTIPDGTPVKVTAIESGWAYVEYNGINAWSGMTYLSAPQASFTVSVFNTNGQGTPLKKTPSWDSDNVTWVPEGAGLTVIHILSDYWGYTSWNGVTGWIHLGYCRVTGGLSARTPQYGYIDETIYTVFNTDGEGLELRTAPTEHMPSLATMPEETDVTGYAVNGDWVYINYNGVNGWSHIGCLDQHPRKLILSRNLEEGMEGKDVTILQERLAAFGYFYSAPTGTFGPDTTDAVRTFKMANSLDMSSAVVDAATADVLNGNPITWEQWQEIQRQTAYREAYKNIINSYRNTLLRSDKRTIMIADITNDNVPELIIVGMDYENIIGPWEGTSPDRNNMRIYTCVDTTAQEVYSDRAGMTDGAFMNFYLFRLSNDYSLYGYTYSSDSLQSNGIEEFYRLVPDYYSGFTKETICISEWTPDNAFVSCTAYGVPQDLDSYRAVVNDIQTRISDIYQHTDDCGWFANSFLESYYCSAMTYDEAIAALSD